MSELNISTESLKRVTLVNVSGRIDSTTSQEFDKSLKSLHSDKKHNIVLNLNQVNYMSSAGLRAIVAAMKECKKHRGRVVLSNPSERVQEVLDLAGLSSLFDIFEDDTTAVGSF